MLYGHAQRLAGGVSAAILVFLFGVVAALAQGTRLPVPDEKAQEEAQQLIREVYGNELSGAKTPDQMRTLAKKMFGQAKETGGDPAGRFVLLKLASDLAAQTGDATVACLAVQRIAETYQIDGVAMKAELLLKIARSARLPEQRQAIAENALAVIAEAVVQDDYATANRLGRMALAEAQKARDRGLAQRITSLHRQVQQTEKAHAKVKQALATLEEKPADPEANLAVGRFLCLMKDDWEKGVPMLALGSDPALKGLALKELKDLTTADQQVAAGDGWWELAEEAEGTTARRFRARAADWYRLAAGRLGGLEKASVEKRLQTVRQEAPPPLLPTGWVRIVNVNSGLCLAVSRGSKAKGAGTIQWPFGETLMAHQWRIVPLAQGVYGILNRNSGQALANREGRPEPGIAIIQWPFNPASAEHQWRIVPAGRDSYGIINCDSGLCLSVPGGSRLRGGGILQQPFEETSPGRLWRIESILMVFGN